MIPTSSVFVDHVLRAADSQWQIVDKKSATLNLPEHLEALIGLSADHNSIWKFESAEYYELVVETIVGEIERALDLDYSSQYLQESRKHPHSLCYFG